MGAGQTGDLDASVVCCHVSLLEEMHLSHDGSTTPSVSRVDLLTFYNAVVLRTVT